ncbi:MAG TPA: DUF1295 domain-containing protein [Stellaceae bacterium]|nr:DUF1295 domain-containing protein [Stellaceae bacterium]
MNIVILLLVLAAGLSAAMTAAWNIAVRTGRSGWIDAIWSLAIGVAGLVGALVPFGSGRLTTRQMVVAALVAAWSARLAAHIAQRTMRGGDDPRYAWLRQEWGGAYRRRLFLFLQIQAGCGFLLALSILIAAHNPAPGLRAGDTLGVLLLVVAILGEAVADRQLARFRADPKNRGRVCDAGLWGVSRHPNYFFEWLGWLAYPAIAIDPTAYAWGWVALCGPMLMYWLLVYASGIPPLEAHMLRSRGAAFRAYQGRVNAFWPGPPRARRQTEPS